MKNCYFVFICALAGAASSGLLLPTGLRAGWLGLCVGLGVVFVNSRSRARLDAGSKPGLGLAVLAGLLAGLGAGIPLAFMGNFAEFALFVTPQGWPMLLAAAGYGVLLSAAYALRWSFKPGLARSAMTMLMIIGAGALAGTLRGLFAQPISGEKERLLSAAMASLITGVPFALLWGNAVMDHDPAYSHERWSGAAPARKSMGWGSYLFIGFVTMMGLAMGVPSLKELVRSSNEGASKGSLGSIRSALSAYYGDNNGTYPASIEALTVGGRYLQSIPHAKLSPYHPDSAAVKARVDDAGGWSYDNDPRSAYFGTLWLNCTHTDARGSVWTSY